MVPAATAVPAPAFFRKSRLSIYSSSTRLVIRTLPAHHGNLAQAATSIATKFLSDNRV